MKTNKILFLDLDGVLCLSNNWGGRAKKWKKYKNYIYKREKDENEQNIVS